ncbi:hypothetical protein ACHAXA_004398 [Cyclostephanos tholiformis]|uniref:Uncharacterized protein n=1 Tax=Cyclostephanos tholiformis TaxID=382380 RepID=A0ABD3REN3_9STRA
MAVADLSSSIMPDCPSMNDIDNKKTDNTSFVDATVDVDITPFKCTNTPPSINPIVLPSTATADDDDTREDDPSTRLAREYGDVEVQPRREDDVVEDVPPRRTLCANSLAFGLIDVDWTCSYTINMDKRMDEALALDDATPLDSSYVDSTGGPSNTPDILPPTATAVDVTAGDHSSTLLAEDSSFDVLIRGDVSMDFQHPVKSQSMDEIDNNAAKIDLSSTNSDFPSIVGTDYKIDKAQVDDATLDLSHVNSTDGPSNNPGVLPAATADVTGDESSTSLAEDDEGVEVLLRRDEGTPTQPNDIAVLSSQSIDKIDNDATTIDVLSSINPDWPFNVNIDEKIDISVSADDAALDLSGINSTRGQSINLNVLPSTTVNGTGDDSLTLLAEDEGVEVPLRSIDMIDNNKTGADFYSMNSICPSVIDNDENFVTSLVNRDDCYSIDSDILPVANTKGDSVTVVKDAGAEIKDDGVDVPPRKVRGIFAKKLQSPSNIVKEMAQAAHRTKAVFIDAIRREGDKIVNATTAKVTATLDAKKNRILRSISASVQAGDLAANLKIDHVKFDSSSINPDCPSTIKIEKEIVNSSVDDAIVDSSSVNFTDSPPPQSIDKIANNTATLDLFSIIPNCPSINIDKKIDKALDHDATVVISPVPSYDCSSINPDVLSTTVNETRNDKSTSFALDEGVEVPLRENDGVEVPLRCKRGSFVGKLRSVPESANQRLGEQGKKGALIDAMRRRGKLVVSAGAFVNVEKSKATKIALKEEQISGAPCAQRGKMVRSISTVVKKGALVANQTKGTLINATHGTINKAIMAESAFTDVMNATAKKARTIKEGCKWKSESKSMSKDDPAFMPHECFKIVISGHSGIDMMVRLPCHRFSTFQDLRREIEEDYADDLPFYDFKFTVTDDGMALTPIQEQKWMVHDSDLWNQGEGGDGTYTNPYVVFIKSIELCDCEFKVCPVSPRRPRGQ